MPIVRFEQNPLITIPDVKPSRDDAYVFGVFNCGATRFGDEILLLLRVAEKPYPVPGKASTFMVRMRGKQATVRVHSVDSDHPEKGIHHNGKWCLPFFSHMRIARSRDGVRFEVDPSPIDVPMDEYDRYGLEDPRITEIDGTWWINYSAISERGISTALISTRDFVRFEKRGIIFCPDNKDVAIFPEKVGGMYRALHRPSQAAIGPSIWIASSPDLLHWGNHRLLFAPRSGQWDGGRVGAGSPPIRTSKGWLEIYHGASEKGIYCLGAMLLDGEDPGRVIGVTDEPVMRPVAGYENTGYLPRVVFCCGHILHDDGRITLYYGASDDKICGAETSVDDLLGLLGA